jgi:hypothetical protein
VVLFFPADNFSLNDRIQLRYLPNIPYRGGKIAFKNMYGFLENIYLVSFFLQHFIIKIPNIHKVEKNFL